jgi:hypothetical protein
MCGFFSSAAISSRSRRPARSLETLPSSWWPTTLQPKMSSSGPKLLISPTLSSTTCVFIRGLASPDVSCLGSFFFNAEHGFSLSVTSANPLGASPNLSVARSFATTSVSMVGRARTCRPMTLPLSARSSRRNTARCRPSMCSATPCVRVYPCVSRGLLARHWTDLLSAHFDRSQGSNFD